MADADQNLKEWLLNELSSSSAARLPLAEAHADVRPEIPDHTLFRRIGKGSYGEVWLARSVLGVWRAVKIVYRHSFDHARPFERELEGIRRFEPVSRSHPSQLNVLHVGRNDAAGYFYYVMELADPEPADHLASVEPSAVPQPEERAVDPQSYKPRTLRSELFRRGRLPFDECLHMGLALATALDNLHRHGLVHRDIKPSNIVFVKGIPKLADIGLVAAAEATLSMVGTEGYVPPEGPGTPQADIFSLGKVLYEMATGRDRQDFPELPSNLLHSSGAELDKLAEMNELISKACHPDPGQRYQSAAELQVDLALLQTGKSLKRIRAVEKHIRFLRRAGAIVTAVALLAAGLYLWQARQTGAMTKLANQNQSLAEENRQRLLQLQTANGIKSMDAGDPITAGLWFAEALKLSAGDEAVEQRHRYRLGTLLQNVPKPVAVLQFEGIAQRYIQVPDGRIMAASYTRGGTNDLGHIRFWDPQKNYEVVHSLVIPRLDQTSRHGNWAIAREGSLLRFWDLAQGKAVGKPFGTDPASRHLTWSYDEARVAILAENSKAVHIVEVPSGRLLTSPLYHSNEVVHAQFEPAGQWIATASLGPGPDGVDAATARIWDSLTSEPLTPPIRIDHHVADFSWAPGRDAVAIFGLPARMDPILHEVFHGTLKVIDLPSGKERFPPIVHAQPVICARFSPNGRYLASSASNGEVQLWSSLTGKAVRGPLQQHSDVWWLDFSPDGAWLAAGGTTEIRIWDVTTGLPVGPPLRVDKSSMFSFTEDGRRLMAETAPGRIYMWDLSAAEPALPLFDSGGPSTWAASSPDGRHVAVANALGQVKTWDTSEGTQMGRPLLSPEPSTDRWLGTHGSWSPDGQRLAVITDGNNSTIRVWERDGTERIPPLRHPTTVHACRFSPDGTRIATSCYDGGTRMWNASTGDLLFCEEDSYAAVVFSADSRRIILTKEGSGGRILDSLTGAVVGPPLPKFSIWAFSPDGTLIAGGSGEGAGAIHNSNTGEQVGIGFKHADGITSIHFSPDGTRLLTASRDKTARIWDSATGHPLTPPLQHSKLLITSGFSPDGNRVVTASFDRTARVWDTESGEPLSPPFRSETAVLTVGFHPDREQILSVSLPGAQVWDVPKSHWKEDELQAAFELMAGAQIEQGGRLERLDLHERDTRWAKFATHSVVDLQDWRKSAIMWHRRRALISQQKADGFAAEFHARKLVALAPEATGSKEILRRVLEAMPKRDASASPKQIDLSAVYNDSLLRHKIRIDEPDLIELPQGLQSFGGITFDVRGIVQLVSWPRKASNETGALSVEGIRVQQKVSRLHFLQAALRELDLQEGALVGRYLVHFANGRTEEIPIVYGRDIWDWAPPAGQHPSLGAVIAWRGSNPFLRAQNREAFLYKQTWENPWPDVVVEKIDFVSVPAWAFPFLVALTAE